VDLKLELATEKNNMEKSRRRARTSRKTKFLFLVCQKKLVRELIHTNNPLGKKVGVSSKGEENDKSPRSGLIKGSRGRDHDTACLGRPIPKGKSSHRKERSGKVMMAQPSITSKNLRYGSR